MTVTRAVAVVLGGGAGNRFGAAMPKQLLTLGGKTLVEHCVTAFASAPGIDEVLLVMPAAYAAEAKKLVGDQVSAIIEGGVTRPELGPQRPGLPAPQEPSRDHGRPLP